MSARNIAEEQERFTITTNRGASHLVNIDCITTDLTTIINSYSSLTRLTTALISSVPRKTIYITSSEISLNNKSIKRLILGLIVLGIITFGQRGVLSGLLTVLWNKRRYKKDLYHL